MTDMILSALRDLASVGFAYLAVALTMWVLMFVIAALLER